MSKDRRNGQVAHSSPAGKQLVFVTNNSTKSRADYKKKFDSMGITASEVRPQTFCQTLTTRTYI